jgi:hypothetical protein
MTRETTGTGYERQEVVAWMVSVCAPPLGARTPLGCRSGLTSGPKRVGLNHSHLSSSLCLTPSLTHIFSFKPPHRGRTMADLNPATTRALGVPELLQEVISHLDQTDLVRAVLVCREWRGIAERKLHSEPKLWDWPDIAEGGRVDSSGGQLFTRTIVCRGELTEAVRAVHLLVADGWNGPMLNPQLIRTSVKLLAACKKLDRVS